ncbi:hypothetical protein [Shewanella gelidii]|uniref:hypothetical protein n=1 Tax=Shewanella gelidii TaxID=1642821 RepID=UPI00166DE972|nr:hypothetical protein [Shewanella gelidii]MCL1096647.1 hypothetical protein [Shewanella gelidii]
MNSSTSQAIPMEDPSLGHLLYGLMTGFPLLLLPVFLSLTINLSQRQNDVGELIATHLKWQKHSIAGLMVMLVLAYVLPQFWLSIVLATTAFTWFTLRIVKGWLSLADGRLI